MQLATYNGKAIPYGGLAPHEEDERDIQVGALFGWNTYKTKSREHIIETLSTKDQAPHNTCGLNSVTVQKELDEKRILSVKCAVLIGKREKYITDNGFISLRNAQNIVQK